MNDLSKVLQKIISYLGLSINIAKHQETKLLPVYSHQLIGQYLQIHKRN